MSFKLRLSNRINSPGVRHEVDKKFLIEKVLGTKDFIIERFTDEKDQYLCISLHSPDSDGVVSRLIIPEEKLSQLIDVLSGFFYKERSYY